ncbi:hypothetical protein [Sphingobium yanoikuyae]|uniref:hypothetical protein n=1 Tax=Sphingobium yanoikuyae TaxID=13690 RepID=UPI0031D6ED79
MSTSDESPRIFGINAANSTLSSMPSVNCEAIIVENNNDRWIIISLLYNNSDGGVISSPSLFRLSNSCVAIDFVRNLYTYSDASFDISEVSSMIIHDDFLPKSNQDFITVYGSISDSVSIGTEIASIPYRGTLISVTQGPSGLLNIPYANV